MQVDFGWIVRGENHPKVDAALVSAARQHFPASGNHFESVKCPSCDAVYLVNVRLNETSNNAYRVEILGAAEVI